MNNPEKKRAPLNRTLFISENDIVRLSSNLLKLKKIISPTQLSEKIINQNLLDAVKFLPHNFVDLLFIDPPYNLSKNFGDLNFKKMTNDDYEIWIDSWLSPLKKILKNNASIYFCSDWQSSVPVGKVLGKHFIIRNRITWEREKGRGAKSNWKNSSEDIWYCTYTDKFKFNADLVKLRRNVIAPYKVNGEPKDWKEKSGFKFRDTYPSNIWTDLTIPFWSMPENTDHPTQKPEKLLAKIILASSDEGDFIFDPFLGSGTTAVVSKKLGRKFSGVEISEEYSCLALKRLEEAELNKTIQGFEEGVFWERNTMKFRK